MNKEHADHLLQAGIEAAKHGHTLKAQELLLTVLEERQECEIAWLWLSSVVTSIEDRRVCLENVLAINPTNDAAMRGLKRLDEAVSRTSEIETIHIVRREHDAVSPAAALIYPERQLKEWVWNDTLEVKTAQGLSFESHSNFDDVWERDSDICAYCATELDYDENRCPGCRRNLMASSFRYQKPSSDLMIYWVLMLGVAQISLVLVMLNLILRESLVSTAWQGVVFTVLVVLVICVYLRQFWAYVTSLAFLLLTLITMLLNIYIGPRLVNVVDAAIESGFFQSLSESAFVYVLGPLEGLLVPLQFLAVSLALLYGILKVGPDFERVKTRRTARVDKGLNDASRFYATGVEYQRKDMWASAVLHYQRAVALDPIRLHYQKSLAEAYAETGFYQRSLDMLESAHRNVREPLLRLELEHLITDIQDKLGHSRATETG